MAIWEFGQIVLKIKGDFFQAKDIHPYEHVGLQSEYKMNSLTDFADYFLLF